MDILPKSKTVVGELSKEEIEQQRQEILNLIGSLGTAAVAIPAGTILPFQNLLQDTKKIKQQEAQRMFPGADPNLFDASRGGVLANKTSVHTIPLSQKIGSSRVFDKNITREDLFNIEKSYPEYLTSQPDAPSPELGSYQEAIKNKTIFPEGDIQAITVTPGPNPSRFAQDYAEVLADKLGKALTQYEQFTSPSGPLSINKNPTDIAEVEEIAKRNLEEAKRLERKVGKLSDKTPGTAGYVWGNIKKPQYSYAEGNWGLGQKFSEPNPSVYVSRINADPSKEANYLFTGNILESSYKEPRARFTQYEDLGLGTGPSWGIAGAGRGEGDISFRKDLIGARGEITTGDLQALLAERNLPFKYQTIGKDLTGRVRMGRQRPGDVLRANLETLAAAENITPYEAIEKFARLVPTVGEPSTPSTPAVVGKLSTFPIQEQAISPFGSFASKTDLRQLGILPPSNKAEYEAFELDEFDQLFKYQKARYSASNAKIIDTYTMPVDPLDPFDEMKGGVTKLIIDRDVLRPKAANKLLDKTVANLIEKTKPVKGLGLGGLGTGAIVTAMDPAVIDALAKGDYRQAGTTAAVNTAVGSALGGATAKGLQALTAAGYVRPAVAIGSALPLAGGVLAGLGAIETGKALNRAYRAQTGKDWVTRNRPTNSYSTYAGPTPVVKPRMGQAILNNRMIDVPYGSLAGIKQVGRPWWEQAGTQLQKFADLLNRGSILGR